MDDYLMEPFRIRCRCVACGKVTHELSTYAPDRKRFTKSWFCGCAPAPKGDPLPITTAANKMPGGDA